MRLAFALSCLALAGSIALATPPADLEKVLGQMDEAASRFRTADASFTWTQYNKVIDDIAETQQGKIYFRHSSNETEMSAEITQPSAKVVIFSDGKIQVYQPRLDQIDIYDAGAHREEFESFLVLGFGGSGKDMTKSFDIKYQGTEKIDSVETAKLDLTPKSEKVRQQFPHILLWIDPQRGLSLQQKLFQANGDYRLAKYSEIQLNQRISDDKFKLKPTGRTKTLTH